MGGEGIPRRDKREVNSIYLMEFVYSNPIRVTNRTVCSKEEYGFGYLLTASLVLKHQRPYLFDDLPKLPRNGTL